ncbi:hypothetical protein F4778DRAFT_757671 [Xylariomycetidae sp. FL2044]|nr:hypothetical protein F4778DRAFT_757671 [Xylariomycetidae sp. FL2044]
MCCGVRRCAFCASHHPPNPIFRPRPNQRGPGCFFPLPPKVVPICKMVPALVSIRESLPRPFLVLLLSSRWRRRRRRKGGGEEEGREEGREGRRGRRRRMGKYFFLICCVRAVPSFASAKILRRSFVLLLEVPTSSSGQKKTVDTHYQKRSLARSLAYTTKNLLLKLCHLFF